MKYNGFWYNKDKRIVIFRVTKSGYVSYRIVDEKGKLLCNKIHKDYIENIISSFMREI